MIKIQCDRCKEHFNKGLTTPVHVIRERLDYDNCPVQEIAREYDLCKDCLSAFHDWAAQIPAKPV